MAEMKKLRIPLAIGLLAAVTTLCIVIAGHLGRVPHPSVAAVRVLLQTYSKFN
jgi:hypothetical protein